MRCVTILHVTQRKFFVIFLVNYVKMFTFAAF